MLPADVLDSFHGAEFLDDAVQLAGVGKHNGQRSLEQSVVAVDAEGADIDFLIFTEDGGDVVDHAEVVVAHYVEDDGVCALASLACPACLDDAIAVPFSQRGSVGAGGAVDAYAIVDGHKSEDVVTVDG